MVHEFVVERRIAEAKNSHGELQSIAGDLPEILMLALNRAKPGVRQLLITPERGQGFGFVAQEISATLRRGCVVE